MHLAHDVFIIKEVYGEFTKLGDSLRNEVETAKAQVKVSDDLRKVSEAREAKLKEELWASKDAIWELQA